MERNNDAREAGNNREHGRHDAGDTLAARSGGRRATCAGEATRQSDDETYREEAKGVVYSHEAHPSQRKASDDAR